MTLRQQWTVVGAVVLVLGILVSVAMRTLGSEIFPVGVGMAAPKFSAMTMGAAPREKSLDDYKGQVVLLNVWATWCPPCEVEMPSIEQLHREFGPLGLKVVAVSIDDPGSERVIQAYVKNHGLTFEILHDAQRKIEKDYQITGYPETFVIARDGTIRKKWISAANWASPANRTLIAELLGVPLPH